MYPPSLYPLKVLNPLDPVLFGESIALVSRGNNERLDGKAYPTQE